MIISAPEIGPMIAGFLLLNVNTRPSGSRWETTGSGPEKTRATPEKNGGWTRIKRRAAKGAPTPMTALTQPQNLRFSLNGREGQAVSKPKTSFYVHHTGLAVTTARQPVTKSTVSEVAP